MSLRFLVMLLQPSSQTYALSFGYNTCERNPKKPEKFKKILLIDLFIFWLTKIDYFPIQSLQFLMYEIVIKNNLDEHMIIRKVWQSKLRYLFISMRTVWCNYTEILDLMLIEAWFRMKGNYNFGIFCDIKHSGFNHFMVFASAFSKANRNMAKKSKKQLHCNM